MGLIAYPQSPNGSPDSPGGTLKPPAAPQLFILGRLPTLRYGVSRRGGGSCHRQDNQGRYQEAHHPPPGRSHSHLPFLLPFLGRGKGSV
jgi:hypothetical protein